MQMPSMFLKEKKRELEGPSWKLLSDMSLKQIRDGVKLTAEKFT